MKSLKFDVSKRLTLVSIEYGGDDRYPTVYWDGQSYIFETPSFSLTHMEEYYTEHCSTLGVRYVGYIKTYTLMELISNDLRESWEGCND